MTPPALACWARLWYVSTAWIIAGGQRQQEQPTWVPHLPHWAVEGLGNSLSGPAASLNCLVEPAPQHAWEASFPGAAPNPCRLVTSSGHAKSPGWWRSQPQHRDIPLLDPSRTEVIFQEPLRPREGASQPAARLTSWASIRQRQMRGQGFRWQEKRLLVC